MKTLMMIFLAGVVASAIGNEISGAFELVNEGLPLVAIVKNQESAE